MKDNAPTLSRNDVVMAFRLFLGREPESEAVVADYRSRGWSLTDLRRAFVNSAEFREKGASLPVTASHKPLDWPKSEVEVDVPDEQLRQMVRHIEGNWQKLGEDAPHWSVLTSDKYKPEQIAETEQAFFETGSHSAKLMQAAAARCDIDLSRYASCFELGCGVGRVTVWLAKLFPSVVAADISRSHLKLAEEAATARGLGNIQFRHLNTIADVADLPPFDCFYSVIVLQHNPPPVMKSLLSSILAKLEPGGLAYFQLPTYSKGYSFKADTYVSALSNEGKMEVHTLPQHVVLEVAARNQCRALEIREDGWTGSPLMISNSFLLRKDL